MAKTVLQNRWFRAAYAALLTVLLSALLTAPVKAAADYTITGKYHQSDARSSLSLINDLRSGDTAWYWNKGDTEKLYFTLNGLTYDYGLEKIAMQRAAEIAVFYSHTRPNGNEWSTLEIDNVRSYAENIAISSGNMNSSGAFQMWVEEDDPYGGQGHRRNMLGDKYTAVGIAHFEFRGVHLFVQEFGYDLSGKSDPGVCDTEKSVNVSVDEGKLKIGASCQYSSFRISYGGTADLPKITVGLKTTGSFADNLCPGLELSESDYTIEWTSENPEIVSVSGSKFTAQAVGSTRLNAKVTNKKDGSYATTGMDVTVEGLDISNLKLSLPDVTYTGTPVTFNISIKYNGKELVKDTDYELSFENNNAPGVGTVIVKGKGSYTGESRNTFNILGNVATATNTPTPKPTATATNTPTPTTKPTSSPTPKPTSTPKPTNTPKPTSTPKPTNTPTPKPTSTPKPTNMPKATVTPKPTSTPKPTNTPKATVTPKPTSTPTPTGAPTAAPTDAQSPTATPALPTDAPTPADNLSATPALTATPTPDASEISPIVFPTFFPILSPDGTLTPEPTEGLIPSPDETITPEPTEGLIPSPDETITPELTDTPSVGPTATPGQPDSSEPTATVTPAGGDGYEIGERDNPEEKKTDDGGKPNGGNSTVEGFGENNGSNAESDKNGNSSFYGWFWALIIVLFVIITALAIRIIYRKKE